MKAIRIRKSVFISSLFVISAIIGYLATPRRMTFSMPLYITTFVISTVALIYYYKHRNKKNYLDFDTLFITTCYLIGYTSTFCYYEFFYQALFFFEFNYQYLNSGSWLFTIGMTAYFCGSLSSKHRGVAKKVGKVKYTAPTPFIIVLLILILLFIGTGGLSYYKDYYMGDTTVENGIATYLLLLISIFNIIIISICFINKYSNKSYKVPKSYICAIGIFTLLLLYCGSRTQALLLLLPILCLYSMLFRPIKLKEFALLLLFGIFSMWVVQNLRSSNEINSSIASPVLMLTDMTIPSRNTFESMDYRDRYGLTYGKTMSAAVIGLVPGLAGIIMGDDSQEFGSAETLTNFTYNKLGTPEEAQIGLGTNTIADIYIAFGLVGTVFLMFYLARLVVWFESKVYSLNIVYTVGFCALVANSVYLARSSLTHPVRYIVWSMVIFLFYKAVIFTTKKYKLLQ